MHFRSCVCIKESSAKAAILDLTNLEKNQFCPKSALFSRDLSCCLPQMRSAVLVRTHQNSMVEEIVNPQNQA